MPSTSAYTGPDAVTPAIRAVAVTPSDSTILPTTRSLYIGGDGNVAVTMQDGNNVTFTGASAGSILPIQVTKVLATGTTATYILALY